jgi:DNA-binding Lrp family transcriptional regulator
MLKNYPLGVRSKQVLAALREHGPLSLGVLAQVLYPPMKTRRCQEVVQNLRRMGLVRRFHSYLPECSGGYYALRKTKPELRVVAEALGAKSNDFEVCFVRGAEIKHGEQCALWAEYLKMQYPQAKVVRDWELRKHPGLAEMFAGDREERDLLPDVVLSFDRWGAQEPVLIAVEVERTRKESRRLVAKVRSLAMHTQLDGVVYVCADFEIGEALRLAFSSAELARSRRIGAYASDFILFSTFDALAGKVGPRCVNAALEVRSIDTWIDAMRAVPVRERSSQIFELPA